MNPMLVASMTSKRKEHPVGSVAIKELYGKSGKTRDGWAVMVKVARSSKGRSGWYWFETYRSKIYADGRDVDDCTGCHSSGIDEVLTPVPLR